MRCTKNPQNRDSQLINKNGTHNKNYSLKESRKISLKNETHRKIHKNDKHKNETQKMIHKNETYNSDPQKCLTKKDSQNMSLA